MGSQKRYFDAEKIIFIVFLILNLVNVWTKSIYVTIDGPAHLYNAGLLNVINESAFLSEFYSQNNFLAPNYFSNLILGKLYFLFDPLVAEKIFISSIVLLLPITFRKLTIALEGKANYFSFLVFTIVFSFLFQCGFFNFSFAFVFLNCSIIILLKLMNEGFKLKYVFGLAATSLILFFTHAFIFSISIPILFAFLVVYHKSNLKEFLLKVSKLTLILLPSLIFFLIFYFEIKFINYNEDITTDGKLHRLYGFQSGIAYDPGSESFFTNIISILLYSLTAIIIVTRFMIKKEFIKKTDIFLVISLLIIPTIFLTKSGRYVGMFTDRLVYLYFYFLILWICCNQIPSKVIIAFSLIAVSYSYINLSFKRHEVMETLSGHALSIRSVSPYIKEKAIVYSVDLTGSWLELHYSNFAVINKEVVITENYEAILGWFPLKWTNRFFDIKCESIVPVSINTVLPDYVLIYGDLRALNEPGKKSIKDFVEKKAFMLYESTNKYCKLFKVFKAIKD